MASNLPLGADVGEKEPTAEDAHQIRTAVLLAAADAVARARRMATVLGPGHPRTWPLAELAARVETAAHNLEAVLAEQPAAEMGH